MGALIIEDRPDVHAIPDQIANMPEIVLTIQVTFNSTTIQVIFNNSTTFSSSCTSRNNSIVVP